MLRYISLCGAFLIQTTTPSKPPKPTSLHCCRIEIINVSHSTRHFKIWPLGIEFKISSYKDNLPTVLTSPSFLYGLLICSFPMRHIGRHSSKRLLFICVSSKLTSSVFHLTWGYHCSVVDLPLCLCIHGTAERTTVWFMLPSRYLNMRRCSIPL